jgi:hypothetical protein
MSWRGIQVSGTGRIVLIGALLAGGLGIAGLRAQTVLGDPRDAARTFASNCSACHKSPRGLAKSGQVAGFLRQHYTTGSEMSAAMAAYLVAAGSAPAEKKAAATAADGTAAKTKGKKQDQLAAQSPADAAEALQQQQRTLRGKQRAAKSHDEAAPAHVAPAVAPAAEETKQTAAAAVTPAAEPAAAPPAQPAPMVLDIPLPAMPDALPPDLTQSVFASSPLP